MKVVPDPCRSCFCLLRTARPEHLVGLQVQEVFRENWGVVSFARTRRRSAILLDVSPETFRAVVELLDHAILQGAAVPTLENSRMRVLRTAGGSGVPPLRLYFFIEHGTLKFTYVGHYHEDEPQLLCAADMTTRNKITKTMATGLATIMTSGQRFESAR